MVVLYLFQQLRGMTKKRLWNKVLSYTLLCWHLGTRTYCLKIKIIFVTIIQVSVHMNFLGKEITELCEWDFFQKFHIEGERIYNLDCCLCFEKKLVQLKKSSKKSWFKGKKALHYFFIWELFTFCISRVLDIAVVVDVCFYVVFTLGIMKKIKDSKYSKCK